MRNHNPYSEALYAQRIEKGWTLTEMATLIAKGTGRPRVTVAQVKQWEEGMRIIPDDVLVEAINRQD